MAFTAEELNYEIYKKKAFKREKWRLFVDAFDATDLPEVSHVNKELQTCTNEKEEMQKLNNRLSEYIEKVQHLEDRNKTLETQLNGLKSSQYSVGEIYKNEMKELRIKLEEREKTVSELRLNLEQFRAKSENDSKLRKDAEVALENLKKSERQATSNYNKMEKNVDALVLELEFQEKVIKELSKSQKSSEWVKQKDEQMKAFERKVADYKIQLEKKKTEIETLEKTKLSLQKKQKEMDEQRRKHEDTIEQLESEVSTTTTTMNVQLSAYQDLLKVKIKLDKEIEEYRKLLDGGEKGIKTFSPPVPSKDPKDLKEGNNPKSGDTTTTTTTTTVVKETNKTKNPPK